MRIRHIAAALAAVILLSGVCTASGTAGGRDNPFLTKSYVDGTFSDSVLGDVDKAMAFTAQQVQAQQSAAGKKSTGAFSVRAVGAGSTAQLGLGDSIILLSGAARVELRSGALVNVTAGAEAVSGRLLKNDRYLGCENADAVVSFSEASVVAVDGNVRITGSASPFSDVLPGDWFYGDVIAAVERGLVNGMTPSTYVPGGTLTAAQCVKLAACMHQLYYEGAVTLTNSTDGAWYRSYADYALQNGILTQDFADYDAVIARAQFVQVFYRALPSSSFVPVNDIADGAIPDVAVTDAAAEEIYAFYRAGILTGYTSTPGYADHAFGAASSISRAEVATILNRMFDFSARQVFAVS